MKIISTAALIALGAGAASAATVPPDPLVLNAVLPDFDAARFQPGVPITNPYFPVEPNLVRTYSGREVDDGGSVLVESVQRFAGPGPELLGVQTIAVSDVETVDGITVEETLDYFAQDTEGNVWYFGEDVTNYRYDDAGNFLGTDSESAWLAGVDGAFPGFIMPTAPELGFNYYQEYAPNDDAVDEGEIVALGQTVSTALATYDGVLVVLDTTVLEPDAREFKYYAPGIGGIRTAEGLDEQFRNPAAVIDLVDIAAIPVAPTLPLLFGALAGLAVLRRRHRADTRRPPDLAGSRPAGHSTRVMRPSV